MKQRVPELTRVSSKGQVVIPASVRDRLGIKSGSLFAIHTVPKSKMVILRKVDSDALQVDLILLREVEKAWADIERGKARRASRRRFLEELRTW